MLRGTRTGVFTLCLGLMWQTSADQAQVPAAPVDTYPRPQEPAAQAPVETGQPVNPDEPMQGGMMRQGMMKSDVRKSAEKKDEQMKETLEEEAESMPPMPAPTPRQGTAGDRSRH